VTLSALAKVTNLPRPIPVPDFGCRRGSEFDVFAQLLVVFLDPRRSGCTGAM